MNVSRSKRTESTDNECMKAEDREREGREAAKRTWVGDSVGYDCKREG